MTKSIRHGHDKFFKEVFSQPEQAGNFLEECLPKQTFDLLNVKSLVHIEGSFLDKELLESCADILYKISTKKDDECYLYILLEHKSYPDPNTPLQLLNYMVRIWRKHNKDNRGNILPHIIPILFYHGKKVWPWEPSIKSQFKDFPELEQYVPCFAFKLHDLSQISDGHIRGTVLLKVVQRIFKYIYHPKQLRQKLEILLRLLHKDTGMQYIETILKYIASSAKDIEDELVNIVDKAIPNGGRIMGTFAEKWEKEGIDKGMILGIEKGKIEGKVEGKLEGRLESIRIALKSKFGRKGLILIDKIRQIDDSKQLNEILSVIIMASSLEDIKL